MNTLTHHQVTADLIADERGTFIDLTQQDGCGDTASVYLHPWQLKSIMQELGVISADQDATKKIATLERRLMGLRDRVAILHDFLYKNSDHLSWEVLYVTATVDIADEFCVDFEQAESDSEI